jgi:hypothetical protein
MEATTEKVIAAYIKIRDSIEIIKQRHKEELQSLDEQLDVLEQELLARCEATGGNISVPNVGRVTRRVTKQYWTSDWPAMYQMIKERDAFHLLQQRFVGKAMDAFLEENPNLVPPGLNVDSKLAVTVTRARAS